MVDMKLKELERVLYFEQFIVTEPGLTVVRTKSTFRWRRVSKIARRVWWRSFDAGIGAEAVLEMSKKIDLEEEKNN